MPVGERHDATPSRPEPRGFIARAAPSPLPSPPKQRTQPTHPRVAAAWGRVWGKGEGRGEGHLGDRGDRTVHDPGGKRVLLLDILPQNGDKGRAGAVGENCQRAKSASEHTRGNAEVEERSGERGGGERGAGTRGIRTAVIGSPAEVRSRRMLSSVRISSPSRRRSAIALGF